MTEVAAWKKEEVARLKKLLVESPVVGVADIGRIPGPQMQEMRASLRGKIQMVGVKNRLLKLAIDDAQKERPGLDQLTEKVDGQTALIAAEVNPFKLFKLLRENSTMAPIGGGQVSPCDIHVKKGPTPFGPGPIVGELQKVGIPAKIDAGKVVIMKDVTPVKEGDVVSQDLANMLAKLELKPVELGIDLHGAFEEDTLFEPDVLDIDEDAILADFARTAAIARGVALELAWPTGSTIQELVGRAYRAGHSLALDADWVSKDTIEELATKAHKIACGAAIESGVDLGDAQDRIAETYATILASIGKSEADLSETAKEKLSNHLGILSGAAAAPAAADAGDSTEEPPTEEEEEDEATEEEAAAGLGDLFG